MLTTINLLELFQIVNVEHSQPHHILGMHEVQCRGKDILAVRAFLPNAKNVTVVDIDAPQNRYPMMLIHEDGFFEVLIESRSQWFPYRFFIEDYNGEQWESYDQYSFQPTISDYDRYLFGSGTHYRIYEKLGAHIRTVDGVCGVSFGVWAPNAKSVSVIGDFNQWDGRVSQMRMLGNSGIWEIFIPGLGEFEKYKFHVKAQDGHITYKSDPYGTYTEIRPQTASIVFDIQKYQWSDQKWVQERQQKDILHGPMNIYEVHLGSWMRVPEEEDRFLTYRELAEKLVNYVKKMGYNYIELLPIEEHPFDGSWGYQVTGYYAPTSRYGAPDDFMYFIDTCHRNGIGVILDWVPAHFPKDSHGLARFDGTALYEHEDPRKGEHPEWGTLIYNFGRNEVKNFLIANALYWIEQFHMDGLRVDAVASMLYLDYGKNAGEWIPNDRGGRENLEAEEFLKHMNSIIAKRCRGVVMIAEESTSWPGVSKPAEYGGLGFTLKWNMGWMNDFLRYMKEDPLFRKYHHQKVTFSMIYAYTENYVLVLSHDEVVHMKGSLIGKMPGDLWQKFANLRAALGYTYGHPGKKLLFMGGEFAQFSEWSEARSLDWNLLDYESHQSMQKFVMDLNHLYLKHAALWQQDFSPEGFSWIECDDSQRSMLAFTRMSKENQDVLVFIINFTPETYENFYVGVPFGGSYIEILNSDDKKYGGSGIINQNDLISEQKPWNRCQHRVQMRIPPLSTVILRYETRQKVVNNMRKK